jgi:hypothetical protein
VEDIPVEDNHIPEEGILGGDIVHSLAGAVGDMAGSGRPEHFAPAPADLVLQVRHRMVGEVDSHLYLERLGPSQLPDYLSDGPTAAFYQKNSRSRRTTDCISGPTEQSTLFPISKKSMGRLPSGKPSLL